VTGPLLTAREVADLLDVSAETVLRWTRRGELPAIKLPGGAIRFREDKIDAWLVERPAPLSTAPPPPPRRPFGDYGDVLARDPCSYCGRQSEVVDHIEPLARGGDDDWSNLTAACAWCNGSKCAQPMLAWLARRCPA